MPSHDSSLPPELETGYRRFRATSHAMDRERYRQLDEIGQSPASMVIACSDSRAVPEMVFDAAPGELFVVRNVAALVPAYAPDDRSHAASAALEFAVLALHVNSIVVMGHSRCGGIQAAASDAPPLSMTDFIGAWMADVADLAHDIEPVGTEAVRTAAIGTEAVGTEAVAARLRTLELRSIERSIDHLRTFPWIAWREADGDLRLVGSWFEIATGRLHVLTPAGWSALPEG